VLRRLRIAVVPQPGQAAGLAAIVAVLAAVLVSLPLMAGAAQEGAWELQRARTAEPALGVQLASTSFPDQGRPEPTRIAGVGPLDDEVQRAVARAGLPAPVVTMVLRPAWVTPTPRGGVRSQLVFRTGAADHVRITAGAASADGVLIPERLAEDTGLGPGDELTSTSNVGGSATVHVTGVYAEPTSPLPSFWADQRSLFLPSADPSTGRPVPPPPAVLAPRAVELSAAEAAGQDLNLSWLVPLQRGIGIDEARAVLRRYDRMRVLVADPGTPVTELARSRDYPQPLPESRLPDAIGAVDDTVTRLLPPIQAVGIGAAAATVVVVGAWAAQRNRRRDDELRALVARGVSPGRMAAHAGIEALLPVLGGAAVGAAVAWLLIRELGPSARFPAGTEALAAGWSAAGIVAALAVVPLVTGVLAAGLERPEADRPGRRRGRLPWIAVPAAVVLATGLPLLTGEQDGGRLGVLTLGIPLLACAVAAGALTALLPSLGRRSDARLRRLPPAASLAVRRTLLARGPSRLVVVTTALALGLVVYAGALSGSETRTIAAKAAVAAPSDVVVPLDPATTTERGPLPRGATLVGYDEGLGVAPGDGTADLLVLDPASFAGVVHWDDALADRSLHDLLAALEDYPGDRVPVLVAGPLAGVAVGEDLTVRRGRSYSLPVEVVGTAVAFPGQRSSRPVVIADWSRVTTSLGTAGVDPAGVLGRQVWAGGEPAAALEALTVAGYRFGAAKVTRAADFAALPEVRAQAWALAYLRAVSLGAGLLALVGVAMHALAQQRRRTVATVLLSRMGMRRRAVDAATALELGLLVGTAALVAVVVALPSSALLLRPLDPLPGLPPGTLFTVPWGPLAAVLAGVLAVAAGGALLVGHAARRVVPGEVLRDAT
jgi:putative ABC transport system permease protein